MTDTCHTTAQADLPGIPPAPVPPRPSRLSDEVKRLAVEPHLEEIAQALKITDAAEKDELRLDLLQVVGSGDGYQLARELEDRFGYGADTALVQACDGISLYHGQTLAAKQWVKDHNITVPQKAGDIVDALLGLKEVRARVAAVREETAQLVVVPPDEKDRFKNGGSHIVDYEDATLAIQEAAPCG